MNDTSSINPTLRVTALQIAVTQLGQKENPAHDNTGTMVNEYLKSVGLKPGFSWCQAFVYWCYEQASKKLIAANPVIHTAGVLDCWNRTSVIYKLDKTHCLNQVSQSLILPGHQFILKTGKISGHTGIVESVKGHTLTTIEGNSNNNGSPDGFEVVRHTRDMTDSKFVGLILY